MGALSPRQCPPLKVEGSERYFSLQFALQTYLSNCFGEKLNGKGALQLMGRLGSASPLPRRCKVWGTDLIPLAWDRGHHGSHGALVLKELRTSPVIPVMLFCLLDQTLPIVGLKKQ